MLERLLAANLGSPFRVGSSLFFSNCSEEIHCHWASVGMAVSMERTLQQFINSPILFIYQIIQFFIDRLLAPTPPPPRAELSRPKVAIIGAGLTGVSAASHVVGHGFDCTIFEAGDRKSLGGIWSVGILRSCVCGVRCLTICTESQQYLWSPNPQCHVPLPPFRKMEQRIP